MPVFVLTHHGREPLTLSDTTFTFVTDGIESALDQARKAAAGKDVVIGGGASAIDQYLAAGLVDELELHIVPLVLGGGARLFEGVGPGLELEQLRRGQQGDTKVTAARGRQSTAWEGVAPRLTDARQALAATPPPLAPAHTRTAKKGPVGRLLSKGGLP
jgi:dihydrofolate reductase